MSGGKTRKISPALRRALDFRSVKLQLVSGRGAIARLCKHVTSNPGWMTEKRSSQISPIYAIGIIIEFMMMASASSFRQTAKRGCFILTAGRSSKSLRHRSCRTNHSPSSSSKVGKATPKWGYERIDLNLGAGNDVAAESRRRRTSNVETRVLVIRTEVVARVWPFQ